MENLIKDANFDNLDWKKLVLLLRWKSVPFKVDILWHSSWNVRTLDKILVSEC